MLVIIASTAHLGVSGFKCFLSEGVICVNFQLSFKWKMPLLWCLAAGKKRGARYACWPKRLPILQFWSVTRLKKALPASLLAKFAIIACRVDKRTEDAITLARQFGVPINVVDHPDMCDFFVPSILDRGPIVAGIGTGGAAPVLAKSVRAKLETLMPPKMGDLAQFAKDLRPAVYAALDKFEDRRRFWEAALNGEVAERVLNGDEAGALALAHQILAGKVPEGVVHIVGAGPGDPDLLTVKALRLLQEADVVYYDKLVSAGIMDLVRRDADRVSVGKSKGNHSVPQNKIHDMLVAAAREGKRVVRLKGGDPSGCAASGGY